MSVMKKLLIIPVLIIGLCSAWATSYSATENAKKKILYIDSYHEGYPWSAGIQEGLEKILTASNIKERIELKVIRMDTKRNHNTGRGVESSRASEHI